MSKYVVIDFSLYSVAVADPIYNADMITAGYSGYTYGWISDFQVNETIQPIGFEGGIDNNEEFYVDIPSGYTGSVSRVGVRANRTETTIVKLFIENKGNNYGYRKTFTVNGTSLPAIMISGLESTPEHQHVL